jgi:hypothetical protein
MTLINIHRPSSTNKDTRRREAASGNNNSKLHNIGVGDGSDDDDDVPLMQLLSTKGDELGS